MPLSFEVFPPSTKEGSSQLGESLRQLRELKPEFISVTCSSQTLNLAAETLKVASYVQNVAEVPAMAHLPALYLDKADVDQLMPQLREQQVKQVLVLRGDVREQLPVKHDFQHASDLVAYIHDNYPYFKITGACYPEMHPEAKNMVEDVKHLKMKVDAGCDQLITQLFLNNEDFYRFRELCAIANINVPILAGIMPVVSERQASGILKTSASHVPGKFRTILAKYRQYPQALRQAGITYAIDQIVDLMANDVDGIHLYTMNQTDAAQQIQQDIGTLFEVKSA